MNYWQQRRSGQIWVTSISCHLSSIWILSRFVLTVTLTTTITSKVVSPINEITSTYCCLHSRSWEWAVYVTTIQQCSPSPRQPSEELSLPFRTGWCLTKNWPRSSANNTHSLSAIIICRFQLALKERNEHNNVTSPHLSLKSSFHAVVQRVHNAVVEEFGDLYLTRSLSTGTVEEEMEDQNATRPATDAGIDIKEFPWATGTIGDTETAIPVASGKLQSRYRTYWLTSCVGSGVTEVWRHPRHGLSRSSRTVPAICAARHYPSIISHLFLGLATRCSPPENLAYLFMTLIWPIVISSREYRIYGSPSIHIIVR